MSLKRQDYRMPGKSKRPSYDYIRDNIQREFLFLCQSTNSKVLLDYWLSRQEIDINDYQGPKEIVPLMMAAAFNNRFVVEYLLEKGAEINMIDFYGDTSLVYAIRRGHIEMVRLLIEKGCNPNLKNVNNKTFLDIMKSEYEKRKSEKNFERKDWLDLFSILTSSSEWKEWIQHESQSQEQLELPDMIPRRK